MTSWRKARRHGFWLAPYLSRAVREEMAGRLFGATWAPIIVLTCLAQAVVCWTAGWSEPTRYIPGLSWLVFLGVARAVRVRRGALDGFAFVIAGLVVSTTIAVLANSVHAPAYWSNLLALAVVVPLYGVRVGALLALWCALIGATWLVLDHYGCSLSVSYPPHAFTYTFLIGCLVSGLGFMSIPTRLLAAALKASERRRRELEVARRAEQDAELAFRAIFEQTGALTALVKSDGSILRLNRTGERLLGVSAGDWEGRSLVELPWLDAEMAKRLAAAIGRASDGPERLEAELRGPAGSRHLQLALAPLRKLDGTLSAIVLEGLDVTRLIEVERQLAHVHRLEALGQLAGGVAHDFNNMLLAIQGGIETIRSRQNDPNEWVEAIDTMEQATHRASELTRKLLAFGRRDRFETQVMDLSLLIADATKLLRRTLGAPIDLQLELTAEATWVEGDASSIEHALVNLLVNARDAMPRGGRVLLHTRIVSTDEAWCQGRQFPCRPGKYVELSVEDEGTGMTDEVRLRAFDPFFTTKGIGKGTGLGLAAVHGTMMSHGGGITLESQVGVGSCFRLYFPLVAPRVSTRAPPSGVAYAPQLFGCVLVVDDEPLVLRVAKRHLSAMGVKAVIVPDARSAIAAIESAQQFDCVLTDVVMPKMSGIALVERIRALRPTLPIVVMSGFPASAAGPAQQALADCPWLRKPFGATDLAKTLEPFLKVDLARTLSARDA